VAHVFALHWSPCRRNSALGGVAAIGVGVSPTELCLLTASAPVEGDTCRKSFQTLCRGLAGSRKAPDVSDRSVLALSLPRSLVLLFLRAACGPASLLEGQDA
jgi:hypothetical protein